VRRALPPLYRRRISALGREDGQIQKILVINLDRQAVRMRQTTRELRRFMSSDGQTLDRLVYRLAAVDARDGRAVAATSDVDPNYVTGNQLYVQPDPRLRACFGTEHPVRMTRQEVAVARSHIEAWKLVANGSEQYVLILEDDVWLRPDAAEAINRGWETARRRSWTSAGPHLMYLSYFDAGAVKRCEHDDAVFRPTRGLWHLSGYVLSRDGALRLLRALPVVGPVDMWMNYRFEELDAYALSRPAILQRRDRVSDNCYSILPYLARAGVVDADAVGPPTRLDAGPIFAWSAQRPDEGLAMALSILGFRVRVFDGDEVAIGADELLGVCRTFDAIVDAPLSTEALSTAVALGGKFVLDADATLRFDAGRLPADRTTALQPAHLSDAPWLPLCNLLRILPPPAAYPVGVPRSWRLFRDDRPRVDFGGSPSELAPTMDDSPWALLPSDGWPSQPATSAAGGDCGRQILSAPMTVPSDALGLSVETFPGNRSPFVPAAVTFGDVGTCLVLSASAASGNEYQSGAFASKGEFLHGRFEVELMAARGGGVVTGFFLHRGSPRQEIDIELLGGDPRTMLVNVYFNAGDAGTVADFGYRGSPIRIDLGFDCTEQFHHYVIEWTPQRIAWAVDGLIVHSRASWDPTPIPHLPMRVHGNVWAPRSETFAGRLDESSLPSTATFRNLQISEWAPSHVSRGWAARLA
jgi:GR25 family glycosyltransferase involved in LPS biosynthesis